MKTQLLFILSLIYTSLSAQELTISGQLRPRLEYKNYLAGSGLDPILIATQRTRLQFGYKDTAKHFHTKIAFQDARIMGNSDQQATSDNNSFNLFEGWAEIFFTNKLSLKIGRQEVYYDDGRILGQSEFSQVGRTHDAALIKYEGNWKIHFGASISTNTDRLSQSYDIPYGLKNYKNMLLFHVERKWNKFKISGLIFNNGLEYIDNVKADSLQIAYNQTLGTDFTWKLLPNLKFRNIYYHQTGHDHVNRKLNAHNLKSTISYTPIKKKLTFTIGIDYFSGNPPDAPADENRSFTTIYGARLLHLGMAGIYLLRYNHGQFAYNNGVLKYLVETQFTYKKWTVLNRFYTYNTEHTPIDTQGQNLSRYLGLEEELFLMYRFNKFITFRGIVGLFNMSETTKQMQNPDYNNWQQWYIFDINIRPELFYKKWDK